MRVGIPRALLYWYYIPLWETFFKELGVEVITTPPTTKEIINKGIKHSVPEICLPIKIYMGHVFELIDQGVDCLFIPRMISIKKKTTFCPKFLGMPDMVRYAIDDEACHILAPHVSAPTDNIAQLTNFIEIGSFFNKDKKTTARALKQAEKVWLKFRDLNMQGCTCTEALNILKGKSQLPVKKERAVNIGLMGYVYNIYDNFISMDVLTKLKNMDVNVVTFEMLKPQVLKAPIKKLNKELFWDFSNKTFAAGMHFLDNPNIDGIIHITAFNCGPDSLLGKLMEIKSETCKKPFMTIRVDEHTGESHMNTRLEAFIDMLRRRDFIETVEVTP
ncbi:MAG: acyl-CoA dehydratase activase-related protein [Mahellales bacterium]|jgi:predicted nucleotide-binding protein (sugar kinase/HSP70/actin superfamily)